MVQTFGKRNVFKDLNDIRAGSDFRKVIMPAITGCDIVLVIIGHGWLNAVDENGNRRLDNPADFVRIEVETALRRDDTSVIPVLVDKARMPKENELPTTLRDLAFKHAAFVGDDPDFHRDVTRLIDDLKEASRPKTVPNHQLRWIGTGLVILLLLIVGLIFLPGILDNIGKQDSNPERDRVIQLALVGVDSNDKWTPYSEVINGVEMVLAPKGCFIMGSTDEQRDYAISFGANLEEILDEQPAHQQCFDEPFWIDKTEVTRAMYQACVDAGVCTETLANEYSNRDAQPINRITWFEARYYCIWRGARLPTEREWAAIQVEFRGSGRWI